MGFTCFLSDSKQRWQFFRAHRCVQPSNRCHWTIFWLFFTESLTMANIHCDFLWHSCCVVGFLWIKERVRVNVFLPFVGEFFVTFLFFFFSSNFFIKWMSFCAQLPPKCNSYFIGTFIEVLTQLWIHPYLFLVELRRKIIFPLIWVKIEWK